MSTMERDETDSDDSSDSEVPTRGKNFGTSPYLDKEGREILNRASRKVMRDQPDWADDPSDPKLSEVLIQLQQDDGFTDTGVMIDLLGKGLNAQEVLVWILWHHSGLEPREIFYAYEGKNHPGCAGVDDQAVRNIESRIRSAAMKLGVNVDV